MTKNEVLILNSALSKMPPFGDFNAFTKLNQSVDIASIVGTEQTNICVFLIDNGLAVSRKDIDPSGHTIQLTDEGRKLKESGSYQRYLAVQAKIKRDLNRAAHTMRYSFLVNCLIAFGTLIAGIYYAIEIYKICYSK